MRFVAGFAFFLIAATSLEAQTAPAAPQQPYTLKAGTSRVLVDVVVRDKKGSPVHGLKQADFEVMENKQPQAIKSFDEHTSLPAAQIAAIPAFPRLPQGQYTNFVPVKQSGTLTIILFDKLNSAIRDQVYARAQLMEYLKHARPDATTAIFVLTDQLHLVQGFTGDPAALLRALEAKGSKVEGSPLRDDEMGGNNTSESLNSLINLTSQAGGSVAGLNSFQESYQNFQSQLQGKYTLDALNSLARSMTGVPGRKNLVWFSGNFPAAFFPGDNNGSDPFAGFAGLEDEFEETVNLLTENQVAIYPVDAQGLRTNAANNAGQSNSQFGSIRQSSSRTGLAASNALVGEDAATGSEHLGMESIAHDTGGVAFYNQNDLSRAVDEAVDSGSNYYSISYNPSTTDKATYRDISVKVNGQSYKLSYRRGYYSGIPESAKNRKQIAGTPPAKPDPARAALNLALFQGGPLPTEILLRIKAGPADAGGDATPVQGNTLNPEATKVKGPYQAFQVDYATSARTISIKKTADNLFHAELDFVVCAYDGKGIMVNAQSNTFRGTFNAKELADALRTGIPFTQKISVPQAGHYTLRVVVRDNISNKVGAVEIPIAEIGGLPLPVATPAANATPAPPPAQ